MRAIRADPLPRSRRTLSICITPRVREAGAEEGTTKAWATAAKAATRTAATRMLVVLGGCLFERGWTGPSWMFDADALNSLAIESIDAMPQIARLLAMIAKARGRVGQ